MSPASAQGRIAIAALKAGAADYVIKEASGEFFPLLRAALAAALEHGGCAGRMNRPRPISAPPRDRFEALADERALIIQEVNHRVGNSLQLVASLLNMQAASHPEPQVKTALAAAVGRVMAVSQVHRRLYTSDDVHSVALDLYLGSLIEDLARTNRGHLATAARSRSSWSRWRSGPDRAVALGVIMTELILNALKYAYPGGNGAVRVFCASSAGKIAADRRGRRHRHRRGRRAVGTGPRPPHHPGARRQARGVDRARCAASRHADHHPLPKG